MKVNAFGQVVAVVRSERKGSSAPSVPTSDTASKQLCVRVAGDTEAERPPWDGETPNLR